MIRFDIEEKAIPGLQKKTKTNKNCTAMLLSLSFSVFLAYFFFACTLAQLSSPLLIPVSLRVEFVLFLCMFCWSFRPPSAGPWSLGPPEGWWHWLSPTPPLASPGERPVGAPALYAPMMVGSGSSWCPPTPAYWGSAACPTLSNIKIYIYIFEIYVKCQELFGLYFSVKKQKHKTKNGLYIKYRKLILLLGQLLLLLHLIYI